MTIIKHEVIRKSEFVAKTQFLCPQHCILSLTTLHSPSFPLNKKFLRKENIHSGEGEQCFSVEPASTFLGFYVHNFKKRFIMKKYEVVKNILRTVNIISSDLSCKDRNARFTIVSLRALSDQV